MSELGTLALLAPAIPLLIGFGAPIVLRASAALSARLAWIGAFGSLAVITIGVLGAAASGGRFDSASSGGKGFEGALLETGWGGLPLQLDALGAVMLGTISMIGAVVAGFALRYLDRDPAQRPFSIWLSYTLAAILTLPLASHLLVLFLAWVMSSHGLHKLLTLYPERPAAWMAARKKFVISRLGDLFLATAFGLIYLEWGSLEFSTIFASASADAAAGKATPISWISALIILGAITKSAQIPFHTWLPDTMEAPTPVSALMHAGIINAGGFLLVRMSPLLALAPTTLTVLAFIGAFSAMTASLIMLTQNDVKRKLAFSTISQMSFMMLQCGLGAFAAAMLHLVGHSFYKAHAFLSAGSWVDPKGASGKKLAAARSNSWPRLMLALIVGFMLASGAVWAMGIDLASKPGGWVLVCVLAIALSQGVVVWSSLPGIRLFHPKNVATLLLFGGGLAGFYLAAVTFMDGLLGESIARPDLTVSDPRSLPGSALVAMFLMAMLVQVLRPEKTDGPFGTRFYVLLRNGFHLGEIQDRWIRRIPWRSRSSADTAR